MTEEKTKRDEGHPRESLGTCQTEIGPGGSNPGDRPHSHYSPPVVTGMQDWKIVRRFPAMGGEADVYLVEKDGVERIFKLYRWGVQPKIEVLDRIISLSQEHAESFVQILERGYDRDSKRFFAVEEYFSKGTLRDLLDSRRVSEEEVVAIFRRLARALLTLHQNGILHLDLKPANILVRDDSPIDLVLTDFGIASIIDDEFSKKMTEIKGTCLYQSPESIIGVVGPKSDWWALGILLLEILLGSHPFEGLKRQVVYYKLTTTGVVLPPSLSPSWKHVLKGLLTRNPDNRWGKSEVEAWLKGAEVVTYYDHELVQSAFEGVLDLSHLSFVKLEEGFSFQGSTYFSMEELLFAFSSSPENWMRARSLLQDGEVTDWLVRQNQFSRATKLKEVLAGESRPDFQLFQVLYSFFPQLPMVWCGKLATRRTILDLLARASTEPISPEEEVLLESLFSRDLFSTYAELAGKTLEDLQDIFNLAAALGGSLLRKAALADRTKILLFGLKKCFTPDQALYCLESALNGDRESEMVIQTSVLRDFHTFAKGAAFWEKGDEEVWKLAENFLSRAEGIHPDTFMPLLQVSHLVASAVGKDRSLRELVLAITTRVPFDRLMFERWNNLRETYHWLTRLAQSAYGIPEDIDCAHFLDRQMQTRRLANRWSLLNPYLLPPVFQTFKDGKMVSPEELEMIKEVFCHPRVLIPQDSTLTKWDEIFAWLEDKPANGGDTLSFPALLELKRGYARTVGLLHQARIGVMGFFLGLILLFHYGIIDVLVLLSLLCFGVSIIWPHLRKIEAYSRYRGRPPFEAVFSQPVLLHQKTPRPFNYLNRAGFLFLILRLSVFHPDFYLVMRQVIRLIVGK